MSLIVDLFAGAGGASLGIRDALGRDPDIAINHDAAALAVHEANHPNTTHLRTNVWDVDPREACGDADVDFLWASPTCTAFSRAKGGPLDRSTALRVRSLAWVVIRWARQVRPRVVVMENVPELRKWGPLRNDGTLCPKRKGKTFNLWVRRLENEGYVVEWRELRACDYGAPTSRKRLFVIARCDGQPIVWPTPTHGPGRLPFESAASCIDWSIPCPSIFGRTKPLTGATMRRIARGIRKFVLESGDPFVIPTRHAGDDRVHDIREPLRTVTASNRGELAIVSPSLIHVSNGERLGQSPRVYDIEEPLGTVVAGGIKHALVMAYLAKHFGGHESPGQSLVSPMGTVTCKDHYALVTVPTVGDHRSEVRAFLTQWNGTATGQSLQLPLKTLTTEHHFGLVTVHGQQFEIADIGMRLLTPRELARAQGFPDSFVLAPIVNGKPVTKTAQIRLIGNSVAKHVAEAIVRANVMTEEVIAA